MTVNLHSRMPKRILLFQISAKLSASLTKISVKSSPKIRVTKNLPAQQLCNFINISISPNVIQAKTKITAVAFIRKILQTEFRTLLSQRMTLPRLLSVLVLANALSGVLSCGGSSPPPPCSWQTCRHEWRDDWNPGISTGECVNQRRYAHHAYDTHQGSGSCPAPSPCSPLTQHRTMCKYDSRCRFFFNHNSPENIETFQTKLFLQSTWWHLIFIWETQTILLEIQEVFLRLQVLRSIFKLNLLKVKTTLRGTNLELIDRGEQNPLFCHLLKQ